MTVTEVRWLLLSSYYLLRAHCGPGTMVGSYAIFAAPLYGQPYCHSSAGEEPETHRGQNVAREQVSYLKVGLEFQEGLSDPLLGPFLHQA